MERHFLPIPQMRKPDEVRLSGLCIHSLTGGVWSLWGPWQVPDPAWLALALTGDSACA